MILDNYIDRKIGEVLKKKDETERKSRKSSGKLSASMLGWPLQWQILKSLGVEPREIDEYTVRKFLRGKQIEDWVLEFVETTEKQKFVEYRGCIGYVDALAKTGEWGFKNGLLPLEVKSTTNLKFKKILKQGADRSHKLQSCFYALATGIDKFAVMYVASDDLRVQTYIYDTAEMKDEVDRIIDRYNKQMESRVVPVFEAEEDWQGNKLYNNFPEWSNLTAEEIAEKLSKLNK